jgi:release factor glutamine methyltransferase
MSTAQKILTILELINKTSSYFKQKNISNSRLNAEQLLARVLNIDRIQLYLQFDRLLSTEEMEKFRDYVRRRAGQEPLQYIIGGTEFMGLEFKLSPSVLVPRPETELLVERTLILKNEIETVNPKIWDIGTGSGCIAISIAHLWPECTLIASDISADALAQAKENASLNKVNKSIEFIKHNILSDPIDPGMQGDIIVSNPPYISKEEFENLDNEIRFFEPQIALTDNSDGLIFYKRIFSLLENSFKCKFALLELSGINTAQIIALTKKLQFYEVNIFNDLNNIPRVLQIKRR